MNKFSKFSRALLAAGIAMTLGSGRAAMNPQMHLGFAHLYAIQPGESLVLHILNGAVTQDAQVCLFETSGAEISCAAETLNPAGSEGDGLTHWPKKHFTEEEMKDAAEKMRKMLI